MLSDIGLVESEQDFLQAFGTNRQQRPLIPWDTNNVVHHGAHFVVLSHDLARGTGVIHFPAEASYKTHLRWNYRLTALERTEGSGEWAIWSPDVFMRLRTSGYEIGIRVREAWWRKQTKRNNVVIAEDVEHDLGTVCLVLCVLPFSVTGEFYREAEVFGSTAKYQDHQVATEKLLGERGWKSEFIGTSEQGNSGETYHHRYMEVWIWAL